MPETLDCPSLFLGPGKHIWTSITQSYEEKKTFGYGKQPKHKIWLMHLCRHGNNNMSHIKTR